MWVPDGGEHGYNPPPPPPPHPHLGQSAFFTVVVSKYYGDISDVESTLCGVDRG